MEILTSISPFNLFMFYSFVRAYYFVRNKGAIVYAKSVLIPIVALLLINIRTIVSFSVWFLIIPIIGLIAYDIKIYSDFRKGKIQSMSHKLINFDRYYIEIFTIFIISFLIAKALGLEYFKGFF